MLWRCRFLNFEYEKGIQVGCWKTWNIGKSPLLQNEVVKFGVFWQINNLGFVLYDIWNYVSNSSSFGVALGV